MVSFYLGLLICAVLGQMFQRGVECGNIAVNTVSVESQNNILSISVTYTAGPETTVRWSSPKYGSHIGTLDFLEDTYHANGYGYTTVRLTHEEAAKHNSRDFLRWLFLHNIDCEVTLQFPPFSRLIALSPRFQDFGGLALTLKHGNGHDVEPGANAAFQRRENLTAILSSPELSRFDATWPTAEHTMVLKDSDEFPMFKKVFHTSSDTDMNFADSWTGNATTKMYAVSFDREDSISGVFKMTMSLNRRNESDDSLIVRVSFMQNVYLVRQRGDEAVPNNTAALYHPRYPEYVEFDMVVSLTIPKLHIIAFGNPAPTVSLRRACSELIPSEVEMYNKIVKSRYEAIHYFRFKNATNALKGSYTIVARSGTMEAREIVTIGIWTD